jgi:Uma2 family endonuclease
MSARTLISQPLISVEEYLASSYEPDCDYVDGHIEERNLGERPHSRLQGRLLLILSGQLPSGMEVLPEVRVQVEASRFRVPDICVAEQSEEPILTKPPLLCVEILSSEDRMSRVEVRIRDYLEMGVPCVWVLDPQTKQAYVATAEYGLREVKSGVLTTANPAFEVPLAEIFR